MVDKKDKSGPIVTEMILNSEQAKSNAAGLVVEPSGGAGEADQFTQELEKTLKETEQAVLALEAGQDELQTKSWHKSRTIVEDFKPVPWFIWRLSNFVLGNPGQIGKVSEGLVFGLRRLLFAAASDSILGSGTKINNVHEALKVLKPDVIASVAVIHGVCRRLGTRQFERIWKPILDDALLRAQIGFYVGAQNPYFGSGRGMLAGFAGRCGLAILISCGDLDQARKALEMLATGAEIKEVGLNIYGCDPLQVSAMTLSASGCGRDSAFGTVAFSSALKSDAIPLTAAQFNWKAAFLVTEFVRTNRAKQVDEESWDCLNFCDEDVRSDLAGKAKSALRRGHGWNWLVGGS